MTEPNDLSTSEKTPKRRRTHNFYIQLPTGLLEERPYSVMLRGEDRILFYFIYVNCVSLAATEEPFGRLKWSSGFFLKIEDIADWLEVKIETVTAAMKSFRKCGLVVDGPGCFIFPDAEKWVQEKSTMRVRDFREKKREGEQPD